jgi:hypothetical protein
VTTLSEQLERARATRRETRTQLESVADDRMLAPAEWRGRPTDVRTLLYRIADGEQERRVALASTLASLGWQQTEAQRILGIAMEARGALRAALLGVTAALLDQAPPNEWSIRQTLEHHLNTEHRYRGQVEYALERHRSGGTLPGQIPDDRLPARFTGQTSTTGPVNVVMAELYNARRETIASFAELTDDELSLAATYGRQDVDVRFRLHRFAAHEREHTIQVVKTARMIGHTPTEAQLILGQAEVARGATEGMLIGVPDELSTRSPAGRQSLQAIVEQGIRDETEAAQTIRKAVA